MPVRCVVTGTDRERVVGLRNDAVRLDRQAEVCLAEGSFHVDDLHTACRAIATMCTSLPAWFGLDGPLTAEQVAQRYASYALALMGATALSRQGAPR